MKRPPAAIFVVTLEAVEGAGGGPRLTVLAFVPGTSGAEAEAAAAAELGSFGWSDIRTLRHGEVTDEAALPEDFRGAFANARRHGCGLIVYDRP
jgi:hypothetical protein